MLFVKFISAFRLWFFLVRAFGFAVLSFTRLPLDRLSPRAPRPPPSHTPFYMLQANMVPVVASNRVGREEFPSGSHIMFYGSSFIADQTGAIVAECSYDGPDPGPAPGGSRNARASDGKSAMEGDETVLKLEGIGEDSDRCEEKRGGEIAVHTFDLEGIRLQRAGWGLFRDRRPDLYQPLLSLDGSVLPK